MSARDLASAGASILSASSFDANHAPSNVLSNSGGSNFWITTGSFPQELVIELGSSSALKSVDLVSLGIRKVEVAKCEGSQANTWETVSTETSDEAADLQKFRLEIPPRITASYIRIKIISAWVDYAVVYKVIVNGRTDKK